MTMNADNLTESWQTVFTGAKQAINWVEETRPQSQSLNNEADRLTLELRRLRNMAKRLGGVSNRPMTTGFFGLSQAGKSNLISALAAGENGNLETIFDGHQLDFIQHINPPGEGSEATGLVTRFSRTAKGGIAGFPIELRLFDEIEVVKILMNSYFNDFDKEKVEYEYDHGKISGILQKVANKRSNDYVAGINEDDVVDLQDYAMDNFGKSVSPLQASYWAKATQYAPYLTIEDRAILFSILWGEIPELTQVYIQFAQTLAKLGYPHRVYAPLSCLVEKNDNGTFSQRNNIMSVSILKRLNTDQDSQIMIKPVDPESEEVKPEVSISLAQLASLTTELVFPLINNTRVSAFEKVDLIDFPGYRGRLNVVVLKKEEPEKNIISQLILRGKVAYLFERYTDNQEMNILIFCTPSNAQSEINEVGPVLERWIHKTQGRTAEERQLRKPGLLWAITKFDIRVNNGLPKKPEELELFWGELMKQTLTERFGAYDWLQNWSNGNSFNNVFLVRKPGFPVAFLDMDEDYQELSLAEKSVPQLNLMKKTFMDTAPIQKYIDKPDEKWEQMLSLNDGGMEYVSNYIETIAMPEVKLQRIGEQLNSAIQMVESRFERWYQSGGAEELGKKREMAEHISRTLFKKFGYLGELLYNLQLPTETIRSLYLDDDVSLVNDVSKEEETSDISSFGDMDLGFGGMDLDSFDLFGETTSVEETSDVTVSAPPQSQFAQNVFKAWIEHLRSLSTRKDFCNFFKFEPQIIDDLVGELITGADRLKLPEQLAIAVTENERAGFKRDQIVGRQVFSMNMLIADFVAWLGTSLDKAKRPSSRVRAGTMVFEPAPLELLLNGVPKLSEGDSKYTQFYLMDWLVAFGSLCEQNAGHSAGREIDVTQNAKLGDVLAKFKQAKLS
ncbi:putative virulence factor [Lonepinella sp. BR2474]|uniref:putative virulence factor n=1 Tax=Lonepinella sp. BR2474 TaxID=3434548 RepID=UPI003F6DFEF2